jgi:hypothetical protein
MSSSIPGPVTRLLEAANRHDTDSFLASFTDDGLVDDWAASSLALRRSEDGATESSSA